MTSPTVMTKSRPGPPGAPAPRFGARASLVTASVWLVAATLVATAVAPADWKLRVLAIGGMTLLPGALAFWPTAGTAWLAAAWWAIPGVLGLMLYGLGVVWLIAAAFAFTGGVTESYRRRHPVPDAAVAARH